ncbi:hypothetical protein Palpr_0266 [Paludibacter propionicigenes WB4]|uniref:Uncharacterized protein n=1 Tax=Paludibacter propionicigenes (strain DSM 17365 / JCM 13257 / WB4) TaxID=694427 RepID=E4T147_PALPW|nr:hypothetical protein Palpr_0266 [Paludibacter propionicigenes WB4]
MFLTYFSEKHREVDLFRYDSDKSASLMTLFF